MQLLGRVGNICPIGCAYSTASPRCSALSLQASQETDCSISFQLHCLSVSAGFDDIENFIDNLDWPRLSSAGLVLRTPNWLRLQYFWMEHKMALEVRKDSINCTRPWFEAVCPVFPESGGTCGRCDDPISSEHHQSAACEVCVAKAKPRRRICQFLHFMNTRLDIGRTRSGILHMSTSQTVRPCTMMMG